MFGQQPQYGNAGYQRGYQPQPGYGQQPPQAAAKMSTEQMLNQIDNQSSKAAFNANSQPGDSVTGIIESVSANQVRDFQTRQPAFWNDGSPQLQVLVTIDTGRTDPTVMDDDGRRTVYIKGWGVQRRAWLQAIRNAGLHKASDIKPGDRFTATFTGYGDRGNAPQPPKLFEYVIEHQSPADIAMQQPQQPVQQPPMQQTQAAYPQQQYPQQQPVQNPNQGYAQPQVDPWSGRPMQAPAPVQPVQINTQQPPQPNPQQVMQLKALGKPPQEIAGMLGVPVEAVTAITDAANPTAHPDAASEEPEF